MDCKSQQPCNRILRCSFRKNQHHDLCNSCDGHGHAVAAQQFFIILLNCLLHNRGICPDHILARPHRHELHAKPRSSTQCLWGRSTPGAVTAVCSLQCSSLERHRDILHIQNIKPCPFCCLRKNLLARSKYPIVTIPYSCRVIVWPSIEGLPTYIYKLEGHLWIKQEFTTNSVCRSPTIEPASVVEH